MRLVGYGEKISGELANKGKMLHHFLTAWGISHEENMTWGNAPWGTHHERICHVCGKEL